MSERNYTPPEGGEARCDCKKTQPAESELAKKYREALGFEAMHDYIIIRTVRGEETRNGIVLIEGADVSAIKGVVVAVGPGRISEWNGEAPPSPVEVGDLIILSHSAAQLATPISIAGELFVGIRFKDVMCRFARGSKTVEAANETVMKELFDE